MCISSFFDIISPNVTECAKKSILASTSDGSYFLDMPSCTIAWRGCRESLNRSASYQQKHKL